MTLRGAITAMLERRAADKRPGAWLVVRAPGSERYSVAPAGVLSPATLGWLGSCDRFEEEELSALERTAQRDGFDLVEYLALQIEERPESRAG